MHLVSNMKTIKRSIVEEMQNCEHNIGKCRSLLHNPAAVSLLDRILNSVLCIRVLPLMFINYAFHLHVLLPTKNAVGNERPAPQSFSSLGNATGSLVGKTTLDHKKQAF